MWAEEMQRASQTGALSGREGSLISHGLGTAHPGRTHLWVGQKFGWGTVWTGGHLASALRLGRGRRSCAGGGQVHCQGQV